MLLVGCYHPADRACEVACGTGGDCPPSLTCDGNGFCKPQGQAEDCSAPFDAPVVAVDAPPSANARCFQQAFVPICLDPAPTNDLMLDGDINTTTDATCSLIQIQTGTAPDVCVIAAKTITIQAGHVLRATGKRPLALVATDSIDVEGTIDVSSIHGQPRGAGGDTGSCMVADNGGSVSSTGGVDGGAGGAAGASFKAVTGGMGGNGDLASGGKTTAPVSSGDRLRGGCSGGRGGLIGTDVVSGGIAGHGGGAIYLLSDKIQIGAMATINASGAGGSAPKARGGGGGGGSGGMIAVESTISTTIMMGAKLYAIGGGGSSGGSNASPGVPGLEATGPMDTGTAVDNKGGGNGGAGAIGNGHDGGNFNAQLCGGGGGGGGGVRICWHGSAIASNPNIQPSPVQLPP